MAARERQSDEEKYIEEAESVTLCRKGFMYCPCFGLSMSRMFSSESMPVLKGTRGGV